MTDTTAVTDTTPTVTPGPQTSEGKLAIVATVLGVLGTVVPPLADFFSNMAAAYPGAHILVTITSVVSLLATILVTLGYAKARSSVKVAALQAGK